MTFLLGLLSPTYALLARFWLPLAAIGAIVGTYTVGYVHGHHAASVACQEAAWKARYEASQRDLAAAQAVQSLNDKWAADEQALAAGLDKRIKEYETSKVTVPGCRLSGADARRVRDLHRAGSGH